MRLKLIIYLTLLLPFAGFSGIVNQIAVDSLLKLGKNLSGEDKVHNLINISREYFIAGDTISRKYSHDAISLAKNIGYTKGEGMAYLFLALSYDEDENDFAIMYYKMSSDILSKIDHPWAAYCYENTSKIYSKMGLYPEAMESYLKALEVYKKSEDTVQIAKVTSSIGFLEWNISNYQNCINWQQKAIKILDSIPNNEIRGLVYGRIGISYDELGEYDSAHFYNNKAIESFKDLGVEYYISQWLSNIGNTYIKQKKYDKALKYLVEARSHVNSEIETSIILINIGKVYLETGKYSAASTILDTAIQKAGRLQQRKFLSEAYYRKYELNKLKGNIPEALDFYIRYSTLKDSLVNEEKTNQINRMSIRYKTEQKEKALLKEKAANEELQKEKALAEIRVYNRNRWIFAIIAISLILVFFLLYLSQKNKRKAQAEKDAAIIEEREKGLKAVFIAQENERKRIAKDLHDGIGQQISATKMYFQSIVTKIMDANPELKGDILKVDRMITETGSDVRSISHQMMPKALLELGLIEALEDLLENCFIKTDVKVSFENFGFTERLPSNVEVALYRIAQELLQNIIKHSGASKVDVQLTKMKNYCILIIEDDGKGIEKEESSDGIGILNINSRLQTINGDLNLDSEEGKGTTATIRIALA